MKALNIINVSINFKEGTCEKTGISVVQGDYNSTKVVFEFDESANDKIKIFEMKNPSDELVYADEIVNNEVILVGSEEVEGQEQIVSLFNEEGDYTFEVSLYGNDSKLTSVCDYITARKEEVVIGDETTGQYLTLFDNLMNELNDKITETNNLNIEASKVEHTTTITITKKDGTSYDVEVLDGETPDLNDYYTKEETYSKAEVNNLIPDLTNYVKNTDYARTSKAGVIKSGYYGLQVDSNNGKAYCDVYTYANYGNVENQRFISKGTLENVITGKELVNKTYVDDLVGDIETILTTLDIGGGISGN